MLDTRVVPDSNADATGTNTTAANFGNGSYLTWNLSGHVTIKVTLNSGPNAVVAGIFFGGTGSISNPPPPAVANWVKSDTLTQGAWIGKYGTQGYSLASAGSSLPTPGTFTVQGQMNWTWEANHTPPDPRDLQTDSHGGSIAAAWYQPSAFSLDLNLTDGATHQIELYVMDWDNKGRAETITIKDANTGTILDTRVIPSSAGRCQHRNHQLDLHQRNLFNLEHHRTREYQRYVERGSNAVVSGIFIDP